MIGRLVALALVFVALPAHAERLVADLSTPLVSIESNFAGSEIALFGVIERDDQTISRPGPYQIIATVAGPIEDVLVQRKERRFGIWVNGEGHLFTDMPSYYAIYATESARDLLEDGGRAQELSVHMLGFLSEQREPFRAALERQRLANGQFRETIGAVDLVTRNFFRALVRLPAIAEAGTYAVRVNLYANDVLLDTHVQTFALRKGGFGAQLWALSRERPFLYGIATVALALFTGYVGGVVFRRN